MFSSIIYHLALVQAISHAYAQVQVQFTSYPRSIVAGQTYTISYIPEGITVTIELYTGPFESRTFVDDVRNSITTYFNRGTVQWASNAALVSGSEYHLLLAGLSSGGSTYSDAIIVEGVAASNTTSDDAGSTPVSNSNGGGESSGGSTNTGGSGGGNGASAARSSKGFLGLTSLGGKVGAGFGIAFGVLVLLGMLVGICLKCVKK